MDSERYASRHLSLEKFQREFRGILPRSVLNFYILILSFDMRSLHTLPDIGLTLRFITICRFGQNFENLHALRVLNVGLYSRFFRWC